MITSADCQKRFSSRPAAKSAECYDLTVSVWLRLCVPVHCVADREPETKRVEVLGELGEVALIGRADVIRRI